MNVKAKIVKTLCSNKEFRIFGAVPIGNFKDLVLTKYGTFTLIGDLNYLTMGHEYELNIEPEDGKFGIQYRVTTCPSLENLDFKKLNYDESYQILTEFTTKKQAKTLLDVYPDFIRLVMENRDNEIDVNKLKNIKDVRLGIYVREIKDKYQYYKFISENKHYSINVEDCKELFKKFGSEDATREYLKNEPYYVLIDILGKQFKLADYLIINRNPVLRNSEQRAEYLMLWALKENEFTGSSKMKIRDMAEICDEYCHELTTILKKVAINSERIYYEDETKWISSQNTYLGECAIAEFVKDRLKKENIMKWDIDWKRYKDNGLTDEQVELLRLVCENNITMVLGSAGCGKTFSVSTMLDMLDDNSISYTLLSPTGRASKIMKLSTNRDAYTIHRGVVDETLMSSRVIVLDEASMVSIEVLTMLTSKLEPHQKIVLIGDEHQLPSIGAGNILKNLIDSQLIPTARLTKVFRYGKGGISTVATDVRNGFSHIDYSGNTVYMNHEQATDYKFINVDDEPLYQILDEYKNLLTKYDKSEIMILSPFNVGSFGTYAINNAIQKQYNYNTDKQIESKRGNNTIKFMVGDIVLNTKNTYRALTYSNYMIEKSLKNDDIDDSEFEGNYEVVDVMNGDNGVIKDIDGENIIVDFDGDLIVYTKETIKNLLLSYSISVHKSQGGQAKAVLSITHPQHKKFLNRSLIYVADTRAQEYLVEIGSPEVIHEALTKVEMDERNTWLLELLTGGINNG